MLRRPIETTRITGQLVFARFHLSGLRVNQELRTKIELMGGILGSLIAHDSGPSSKQR